MKKVIFIAFLFCFINGIIFSNEDLTFKQSNKGFKNHISLSKAIYKSLATGDFALLKSLMIPPSFANNFNKKKKYLRYLNKYLNKIFNIRIKQFNKNNFPKEYDKVNIQTGSIKAENSRIAGTYNSKQVKLCRNVYAHYNGKKIRLIRTAAVYNNLWFLLEL